MRRPGDNGPGFGTPWLIPSLLLLVKIMQVVLRIQYPLYPVLTGLDAIDIDALVCLFVILVIKSIVRVGAVPQLNHWRIVLGLVGQMVCGG